MTYAIGFDIGGTTIKGGVVSSKGIVRDFFSEPTPHGLSEFKTFFKKRTQNFILLNKKIAGIGVGVPGMVDLKTKKLLFLPHLAYLKKFNIPKYLKTFCDLSCLIDNDAHCALEGQLLFNHFNQYSTVIMLTLGTGTGSAIAIHGELFSGSLHSVGGLGEMIIQKDGALCTCGRRGCLNAYTGSYGIRRLAKQITGHDYSPEILFRLAMRGDKKALSVLQSVGSYLGLGLANIYTIFAPELIVITGSISKAWPLMENSVRNEFKNNLFGNHASNPRIKIAENVNKLGVIGAASLILKKSI